jgi:hypothetical protein
LNGRNQDWQKIKALAVVVDHCRFQRYSALYTLAQGPISEANVIH